jgi:hypothetical protein
MEVRVKLLVTGSRHWENREQVFEVLDWVHENTPVTLLIHGGAKGVDAMAATWALRRGISQHIVKPDWKGFGRRAGIVRNVEMVELCDRGVAFRAAGVSNGTDHCATELNRFGKLIALVREKGRQ